jgi:methylated-DNA-protein-cysteine methyltransferase-like protein
MAKNPAITFSEKAKSIIKRIPRGKVATYGQIAALAGNPLGARQVAWVLNSSSRTDRLPWHRVINGQGRISLPKGRGYETQRALLAEEGVVFNQAGKLSLSKYQWQPQKMILCIPASGVTII